MFCLISLITAPDDERRTGGQGSLRCGIMIKISVPGYLSEVSHKQEMVIRRQNTSRARAEDGRRGWLGGPCVTRRGEMCHSATLTSSTCIIQPGPAHCIVVLILITINSLQILRTGPAVLYLTGRSLFDSSDGGM